MKLIKYKIGNIIELFDQKCNIHNLTKNEVSGINKEKEFFEPTIQVGSDTSDYKIVPPGYFACNLMHVGRDVVLPIALNRTSKNKIVSPAYTVFKIKNEGIILKNYFFLLINSSEKDRYFWFNCDSSIRDGMEWDRFCDIEIELPPLDVQKKYVVIYENLLSNLQSYEKGLDDLKLVCDAYIEKFRRENECIEILNFIEECKNTNFNLKYGLADVVGVSNEKKIIPTKADASQNDLSKFIIVEPESFIYNPRNGVAIALNNLNLTKIISWNNACFKIKDCWKSKINPFFLLLYFCRKEWDRKTRFLSWGSSTEVFTFDALCSTKIPLININQQNKIIAIQNRYINSLKYIEKIKTIISKICPILIKGCVEEARRL